MSFPELTLVFVVGLLVLGPERLPDVASRIFRFVGRARRRAEELRRELERQLLAAEAAAGIEATAAAAAGKTAEAAQARKATEAAAAAEAREPGKTPGVTEATEAADTAP